MASKVSKPYVFPKTKVPPMKTAPVLKPQQALRQFHTTPVVPVLKQARINKIVQAPKSPLKPPKEAKVPINPVAAANPLAPLKTYLP